eukprot:scaffold92337_cov28-Tisochrysis_lutea.AAC.3
MRYDRERDGGGQPLAVEMFKGHRPYLHMYCRIALDNLLFPQAVPSVNSHTTRKTLCSCSRLGGGTGNSKTLNTF